MKAIRKKSAADDLPPLSAAQTRELRRRIKDLDDRRRYLLVSKFTPSFILYYNVSDDTYVMNQPSFATLFKPRAAARAVQALLGGKIQIVRCRVDRSGALVVRSMRAIKTDKNRITPPKKIADRAKQTRDKLTAKKITMSDVKNAIRWARKQSGEVSARHLRHTFRLRDSNT